MLLGLICSLAVPVHAGDINAAEQTIIDYYNGTVDYKGKTYRFTEEGKQKAYNKLISDDVDLTAAEAASAIRQANANLQQGIDEGYLVEVGNEPDTETPDTENPDPDDTETPDPNEPDTEIPGTDTENPGNLNNQTPGGSTSGTDGNLPTQKPTYSDAKKTDVQSLLKKSLEEGEYAKVNSSVPQGADNLGGGWAVTVEQFLKGTVDVVKEDGSVVLSTGLAIKNTGYYTGGLIVAIALFICITGGVLVIITLRKKKGYFSMPVLTTAAGIAAFVVFAGGFLESEAGKWNALWLAGSPEYTYAAESGDGADTSDGGAWIPPLQGEQYGEILCDAIGLQAPLYYGDTTEILAQGVGTYTGGKLPGQGGGILAGGHDATFFAPLEQIQKGMILSVKTGYGQYEYEVTGTEVADVMEYQRRQTESEELVLYTCYPFGAETELRNERFFVYAKKVSGAEIGE